MARGPGTVLHDLIAEWTGEEPNLSCSCAAFIRRMDNRPNWAKTHINLIVAKLIREAKERSETWKLQPAKGRGRRFRRRLIQGAVSVPGGEMLLDPFVRAMVHKAIAISDGERGGKQTSP